jgi:phage-related protein
MDSMYGMINGWKLSDFNIYIVNIESGLVKSPFLSSQEIIEDYSLNGDIPYYYGTQKKPLELDVTFAKIDGKWTLNQRREFARMLDPDDTENYLEFNVPEINKIYYVKYTDGIDIYTNGCQQGYLTVKFRCDSPYSYSPLYVVQNDFSTQDTSTMEFINMGDTKCYTELWINKVGAGDIQIKNITNNQQIFSLTGLTDNEIVYINNEFGDIETDLVDTLRYTNHNGVYLEMVRGVNRLEITGRCRLKWKYRFTIKG